MDLAPYVESLHRQLAVAAEAGGEDARALAERLTAPLDAAARLMLLEVLSAAAGEIRGDVEPLELLRAVSRLCSPADVDHAGDERMVTLLIDGLRYGATLKPQSAGF